MLDGEDQIQWPEEIWLAELDEHHNGTGMVVLSEFATVARWEGDDERDCAFQRYVDADTYESADKYWRNQIEAERERAAKLDEALRGKDAAMQNLFELLDQNGVDYSHLIP